MQALALTLRAHPLEEVQHLHLQSQDAVRVGALEGGASLAAHGRPALQRQARGG
jgi:hypothetical protein